MDSGTHTAASNSDESAAGVDCPIYTADRIVIDQERADKMKAALNRNAIIRDPSIYHRAPNYYEQVTALHGFG